MTMMIMREKTTKEAPTFDSPLSCLETICLHYYHDNADDDDVDVC